MTKITIKTQEGVVEDTLTIHEDSWGDRAFKNCPTTWNMLKWLLEKGNEVVVERTLWSGEKRVFNWEGSPSYNTRF